MALDSNNKTSSKDSFLEQIIAFRDQEIRELKSFISQKGFGQEYADVHGSFPREVSPPPSHASSQVGRAQGAAGERAASGEVATGHALHDASVPPPPVSTTQTAVQPTLCIHSMSVPGCLGCTERDRDAARAHGEQLQKRLDAQLLRWHEVDGQFTTRPKESPADSSLLEAAKEVLDMFDLHEKHSPPALLRLNDAVRKVSRPGGKE